MISVARCHFDWRVTRSLRLPEFSGSMLRGAFGHSLRRLACMTRAASCEGCPLLHSCPYPALFAPPPITHPLQRFSQMPAPYLIEPPPWGRRTLEEGDEFSFSMVLFGRALRELPLITLAWNQAFARGVGAGDGQAKLIAVRQSLAETAFPPPGTQTSTVERLLHAPNEGSFTAPEAQMPLIPSEAPSSIRLELLTPMRLQENGRALPPARLNPRILLMALVRRTALIASIHGDGPPDWDFPALSALSTEIQDER
ncbi:MAG: hypothetical protein LWW92_13305, partial [Rhodocyclales bacterium]|nr:hypothetical protein [Rhodocyclales bacterium]